MPVKKIMQKESKSRNGFAEDPLSLGQISTLYGLKMRKKIDELPVKERSVYTTISARFVMTGIGIVYVADGRAA